MEKKLEEILISHLKCIKELLDCANTKRAMIVKNDTKSLDQLLDRESSILAQMNELELSRLRLFKENSKDGHEFEKMKVLDVIDVLFIGDVKSRLNKLQKAIKQIMIELKKVNETNKELLSFAITNMNDFFDTLFQASNPPNIYNARGVKDSEKKRRTIFLDKQA